MRLGASRFLTPRKMCAAPFPHGKGLPRTAALLCVTSVLFCSGCWFQKAKPVAFTPPPPHPPAKKAPPPVLPAPPLLAIDLSALFPPELPATVPDLPAPKPPPRPRPTIIAGPKPPATLPDQPATPKIGQLFTPEQTREYNKELDESLERVRKQLTNIGAKKLSAEEMLTLERIQTFQKQAEQVRQEDLVTAVNLARRADQLAQDLLGHLP